MKSAAKLIRRFVSVLLLSAVLLVIINVAVYAVLHILYRLWDKNIAKRLLRPLLCVWSLYLLLFLLPLYCTKNLVAGKLQDVS